MLHVVIQEDNSLAIFQNKKEKHQYGIGNEVDYLLCQIMIWDCLYFIRYLIFRMQMVWQHTPTWHR